MLLESSACNINKDEDFGGRWSTTLNFSYGDLKTGKKGNVRVGKNFETFFDVDFTHSEIAKKATSVETSVAGKNVVMSQLSLVFKSGDEYHAVSNFLKERKTPLAFLSGGAYKSTSLNMAKAIGAGVESHGKTYLPMELFENFKERLEWREQAAQGYSAINHSQARAFYDRWCEAQRSVMREAISQLESQCEKADPPFPEDALRDTQAKSGAAFGAFIDSEQYLLSYLDTRLFPSTQDKILSGEYIERKTQYEEACKETARDIVDSAFSRGKPEDVEKAKEIITSYNEHTVYGVVLHIHSTLELCQCCCYSIAQTLRHKWLPFIEEREGYGQFFHVAVSASRKLQSPPIGEGLGGGAAKASSARPPGIGDQITLSKDHYDGDVLNLPSLMKEGVFVQWLIPSARIPG